MDERVRDARKMAKRLINNYMGVRPNEEVLIVVDPATDMIMPEALAGATLECGARYTIAVMPESVDGENATTCTNIVAMGAKAADVYIGMTRS